MNMASNALNVGDHRLIAQQVRYFKFGVAGLAGAEQLAGTADFEVFLGDDETVVAVAQDLQALLSRFGERRFIE